MFFDSVLRTSRVLIPCLLLACPIGQAVAQANDFHVVFNSESRDEQKYLTFGLNGWSGHTVHWRYNDANRAANIASSSSVAVNRIQGAMAKWAAVCNVQFIYDGSTTAAASLSAGTRDHSNVITWGPLPGNTTGVTYVSASGVAGQTASVDEADMVINYQFNPTFDAMLLHEVGHMLGLDHSNQENAVMSGPNAPPNPSTTYTTVTNLQPDDIAGCQVMYGESLTSPAEPIATASVAALAFANTTVGAASSTQTVTLTNTGSTPLAINYTTVSGNDFALVSTTCNAGTSLPPGASCVATARFTPTTSGARNGSLNIGHNATPGVTAVALSGGGVANSQVMRQMVEYRFAQLDYYFITSRDSDKAILDATSGFTRTGTSFQVYAQPQGTLLPITRFYFDRVALGATRGSHFYTLLESDIQSFVRQNPTQSTAPGFAQNEDIDSYAFPPLVAGVGGSCASGLLPVYRLFRGAVRFPDNPNHRFTTSVATYNSFVAMGWDGEGVNFCVPAN